VAVGTVVLVGQDVWDGTGVLEGFGVLLGVGVLEGVSDGSGVLLGGGVLLGIGVLLGGGGIVAVAVCVGVGVGVKVTSARGTAGRVKVQPLAKWATTPKSELSRLVMGALAPPSPSKSISQRYMVPALKGRVPDHEVVDDLSLAPPLPWPGK